jgi:hypothetical protein
MVAGKVKIIIIGFTIASNKDSTKDTRMAVKKSLISIPGSK